MLDAKKARDLAADTYWKGLEALNIARIWLPFYCGNAEDAEDALDEMQYEARTDPDFDPDLDEFLDIEDAIEACHKAQDSVDHMDAVVRGDGYVLDAAEAAYNAAAGAYQDCVAQAIKRCPIKPNINFGFDGTIFSNPKPQAPPPPPGDPPFGPKKVVPPIKAIPGGYSAPPATPASGTATAPGTGDTSTPPPSAPPATPPGTPPGKPSTPSGGNNAPPSTTTTTTTTATTSGSTALPCSPTVGDCERLRLVWLQKSAEANAAQANATRARANADQKLLAADAAEKTAADAAAAVPNVDEGTGWVESGGIRLTSRDLKLASAASQQALDDYQAGKITAGQLQDVWQKSGDAEEIAKLRDAENAAVAAAQKQAADAARAAASAKA
ncbi:MAG: hypothetical protein ACRD5L_06210, partial [Bryobacteraceae bacterium]